MKIFKRETPVWLPFAFAGVAALLFLIQALIYAHTTVSSLDEGSYLIKGIFYLKGIYRPFEPHGPLTNKAPFAFLIPGLVESIFGAGLRTGRYFSIFLGLLTLLAVWIVARRWTNAWLAAFSVWTFAAASMVVKLYAQAVSEVLVACMVAWICVLVLDEERPLWKIVLAALLAAAAIFTRQNMAPILPFVVLYVFWQHGKRKGFWALAVGALFLLALHALYWPRVLTIWAPWLPKALTPFLDAFRVPADSVPVWNPDIDFWNRLNAFFQGLRYHFVALLGGLFALILFPRRAACTSPAAFRAAVFLAVSYFVLAAMHGWASLASRYESYSCVFCFANYLGFFDPLGVLFFVLVFWQIWNRNPNRLARTLILVIAPLAAMGMGYSLFEQISDGMLYLPIVPRFRADGLGFAPLADFMQQAFDLSLIQIRRGVGSTLGLIAWAAVYGAAFFIWKRTRKNFALIFIHSFLIVGFLLSPILNLGASRRDCQTDVIRAHEELGAYLAATIPAGSLVYWDGGNAFTPMVYVPQARIFPPQINDGYTYHIGGDADALYYFSHWNAELDARWRAEADVFIIEAKRYMTWKNFLTPQNFKEYARPSASPACADGAELRIFKRLP
ncbi:MAG: glycosyltransferase family 39 protein [Anaerolineales bacterium]|nr:glycosyltransferase family 39 protein [Anaerolineales bacterium]